MLYVLCRSSVVVSIGYLVLVAHRINLFCIFCSWYSWCVDAVCSGMGGYSRSGLTMDV